MLNIWLLIISGVILVPIASGIVKELETKLKKKASHNQEGANILWFKIKDEEEIKTLIKVLNYFLVTLFTVIVIMMIRFTSQLIYEN